jgi:hypothetical protein
MKMRKIKIKNKKIKKKFILYNINKKILIKVIGRLIRRIKLKKEFLNNHLQILAYKIYSQMEVRFILW